MSKIWLALVGAVMAFSASAAQYSEGSQYVKLDRPSADQPQVLEFFSFYCPHCYQFENVYRVSDAIKTGLPEGVKVTKYHVDFLGPLGKDLSKAWAIAVSLGVQDKVAPLIFDGIQKSQTINSVADIRNVFIKAGVKAEEYDDAMNSFTVNALVTKQTKAAEELQLRGVPAVFVNGKYMVKNDGLDIESADQYGLEFSKVVNHLLALK